MKPETKPETKPEAKPETKSFCLEPSTAARPPAVVQMHASTCCTACQWVGCPEQCGVHHHVVYLRVASTRYQHVDSESRTRTRDLIRIGIKLSFHFILRILFNVKRHLTFILFNVSAWLLQGRPVLAASATATLDPPAYREGSACRARPALQVSRCIGFDRGSTQKRFRDVVCVSCCLNC